MQQYVLDWIKADIPANAAHHFTRETRNRWRGALLRTLVNAHTVLECNGSANSALKVYFKIADDILALRASHKAAGRTRGLDDYAATSLWPAEITLGKALYSGNFLQTDSQLYDRFVSAVAASDKNTRKRAANVPLSVAKLRLLHPFEPEPGPTLSMLQQYYSTDADESGYQILTRMVASGTAARVNLLFTMTEVEHLLRSQARLADADWVAEKYRAFLTGSDDKTRQLYKYHDASPEMSRRRRQEERRLANLVEARSWRCLSFGLPAVGNFKIYVGDFTPDYECLERAGVPILLTTAGTSRLWQHDMIAASTPFDTTSFSPQRASSLQEVAVVVEGRSGAFKMAVKRRDEFRPQVDSELRKKRQRTMDAVQLDVEEREGEEKEEEE
ncbi:hypothetical protein LTR17_023385 [Elasticomyces elasticus]|nr:hypothetical protein LTR17_023385 [Elasticomyces elasticus]